MLLNGGALNDVRLIAPKTVALMTSDAVPPGVLPSTENVLATTTIVPSPRNGLGFGLGFAVRTAQGRNSSPGSVGSYFWLGASGPAFFIDPAEKLIAIQMIRVPIGDVLRYQRLFQTLVYQALTEP
jgi:CubicO group peptidase (beta-lactamase class C family)